MKAGIEAMSIVRAQLRQKCARSTEAESVKQSKAKQSSLMRAQAKLKQYKNGESNYIT